MKHLIPDIPVAPHSSLSDAWESWCSCGYGLIGDSPEATVIAMGRHLEETQEEVE